MKGSLTAIIVSYLDSTKRFRYFRPSQFYWLLLFSCTSVFLGSSAIVGVAAPQQIAQQVGISRPTLKVGSQGERVSELQAALKLLGFYSGAVDGNYNEATANAVSRFKQTVGLSPDGIVDAATWQRLFPNQPFIATTASPTTGFPIPKPTANTNKPEPKPTNRPTVTNNSNRTSSKPGNNQVVNSRPVSRTSNNSRQNPNATKPSSTPSLTPTPPAKRISGIQYTSEGWPILRVGMSNAEVTKLQTRLSQLGFLKGGVDGYFGVMTEEAVKAAQKRYGINPDGVVGGATWEALLRRTTQRR